MKKKIWLLVEVKIESSRKSNFAEDLGGIEVLTLPNSQTKILSQDIVQVVTDTADIYPI